jgi:hypothetical protein
MNPEKWKALLNIQEVHGECHPGLAKAYIEYFKKYAPPPRTVLQIGLGEGPLETDMLVREGYTVTGITIRPWQVLRENILLMDMHDLHFKPDAFDSIFSAVTFEHSYSPWLAVMEAHVVLREGGVFFMVVPLENEYHVSTHPNLLSMGQWMETLSYAGFKIRESRKIDLNVMCPCESSDMGITPSSPKNHSLSMNIVVAEKGVPQSRDVLQSINLLREIHKPVSHQPGFPHKHLIEPCPKRVSILWSAIKDYLREGDTVFDLNCGYSHLTPPLTSLGHKVTGVEINEDAVEWLREHHPNETWIQADSYAYLKNNEVGRQDILLLLGTSHPPMTSEEYQNALSASISQMNPRVILIESGVSDAYKPWVQAYPMTMRTLTKLGYEEKSSGSFDATWPIEEVKHRKFAVLERGEKDVGTIR